MRLKGKNIVVTGGGGFLGKYVVEKFKKAKPSRILVPRSFEFDLTKKEACEEVVSGADIVIHLAAQVGGIEFINTRSGEIFYNNLIMGVQLMEEARKAGVKKFVSVGTVCSYPKVVDMPFKEEDLWEGYPENTTAPYGIAKKMLIVQGEAYQRQYGFNSVNLIPVNLYGPGDNFDRESGHVIPSLIKKIVKAKEKKERFVEVWGSGLATREFLYVEDAAEGILLATEKYDNIKPINLGTGKETSIREVSELIMKIVGYKGQIKWDKTKPDGQPRRKLDVSKAKLFGFVAKTPLKDGLERTVTWYLKNKKNIP